MKNTLIKTKKAPRWVRRQQRRLDRKEHLDFCELTNESPEPLTGAQISAAKLKGSPEYNEKRNKMAERRAHVRTHEPDELKSNVRNCGCCTDSDAPDTSTYCCVCASYGAPDMKPLNTRNKWGFKFQNSWLPEQRKRKRRPCDKPCTPLYRYMEIWPLAEEAVIISVFKSLTDQRYGQEYIPSTYSHKVNRIHYQ